MEHLTSLDMVLEAIGENPHYWNLVQASLQMEPKPYRMRLAYSDVFGIYHRYETKLSPSAERAVRKAFTFELASSGSHTNLAKKYGKFRSTFFRDFQRFDFVPGQRHPSLQTENEILRLLVDNDLRAELKKYLSREMEPWEIDLAPSQVIPLLYRAAEVSHIAMYAHIHEFRRHGTVSALAKNYGFFVSDMFRHFSRWGISAAGLKNDDYFVFLK